MSDNDLIRRGDAIALTCDPFGAETVTSQAITALPAVQPTVKPLVWMDFSDRGAKAQAWNEANYMIQRWSVGRWEVNASYPGYGAPIDRICQFHPTLEAAKAAAQADYEARILSALDMQPTISPKQLAAQPDDVAALVEALVEISDRHIPDQPAAYGGDEADWAQRQHTALRSIARAALARVKGDAK